MSMRVAIVSDGLAAVYGGAERILEEMLLMYPSADLFTLVDFIPPNSRAWLRGRRINTSFIQKLPGSRRYFRSLLSLWPIAVEQFELEGYDLIISLQFAVSHGVLTGPNQVHVAYTCSPMRYAWDLQNQYLREANLHRGLKTIVARPMLHRLRMWDAAAAGRVDSFGAISSFVAKRIKKYYQRDSTIVYPPVFLDRFTFCELKDDYYLYLGRLVVYKRVDLIVDAFAKMLDRKLVVAGNGPMLKALQARATPNVHFVGEVDRTTANALMGKARAFIFPPIEDFGIAPLEAQASGTPVIGLGIGGLCETIHNLDHSRPTGVLFSEQSIESLRDAVDTFERVRKDIYPADCAENAGRFSTNVFREEFRAFVDQSVTRGRYA